MDSNMNPDVSGEFPLPQIFDRTRFPNLDQQENLPYTSTGSYNHYDQAQNFQAHATNDGYQVTEQPLRPQAVYCQPQSCQAQAPNDGYQAAEQPMRSQTVYGQARQLFSATVESRRYQSSANESQLEVERTQSMEDEKDFMASLKTSATLYKKIMREKDDQFVAQETANKARLESANAEIIRLQNGERSNSGEIKQLNAKVNKLDADKILILNENQNLKEQLVHLGLEKQLLTETMSEKTSEIETLNYQLSDKATELGVSNAQISALNGTLAEKEVEVNQLHAKTNSLSGELAAEKEEKKKISIELEMVKREFENAKLELAKKKKTTIQQNFLMVSTTSVDSARTVSQKNGVQRKSVKRPIPTIDIDSGAEALPNVGSEQEEVHSARKTDRESFKRKRNVKIQMGVSTTRYCDADESSHNKNGPSHQ